jgi:hypothetical protein
MPVGLGPRDSDKFTLKVTQTESLDSGRDDKHLWPRSELVGRDSVEPGPKG